MMVVLCMAWTTPVWADDTDLPSGLDPSEQAQAQDPLWKLDVAAYFWAFSVTGTVTRSLSVADIDIPFHDAIDYMSMALPLHAELWRKGRVGLIADINWMRFDDDPDVAGAETDVTMTMGLTEGLVAVRLYQEDQVGAEILLGARWVYLKTEFDGPTVDGSRDRSLIDPVIGSRITFEPVESLVFWLRADVGGFGVGTDISGNMAIGAQWNFARNFGVSLGYRGMALEMEKDRYIVDLSLHGPFAAVNLSF
jgi:hypothetical protein